MRKLLNNFTFEQLDRRKDAITETTSFIVPALRFRPQPTGSFPSALLCAVYSLTAILIFNYELLANTQ
jgi:hypothetical protein